MEHLLLFLVCLRNNWVFVPFNYKLKPEDLKIKIKTIDLDLLLFNDSYWSNPYIDFENVIPKEYILEQSKFRKEFILWKKENTTLEKKLFNDITNTDELSNSGEEADLIYLSTSGTTGSSKIARLSRRMIFWNNISTCIYWGLDSNDSTLIHTPLYHAGGLNVFTTPLLFCGGTLILHSVFNPQNVISSMKEKLINILFAVPTMFNMLIAHPEFSDLDMSHMKFLITGGAPCPQKLYDYFQSKGVNFKQGFGMTEAGVNCFFIPNTKVASSYIGTVGVPMPFCFMSLIDENKNEIHGEGEGELCIRGPLLFSGYLEEDNSVYHPTLGFKSGDIFYRNEDGYYFVVGRRKEIIIRGGENIHPLEIEFILQAHPDVKEVSVIGKQDELWGEIPVMFLVLNKSYTQDEVLELGKYIKTKIAPHKIPREIYLLDSMPLNSTGKIDKLKLKEMLNNNSLNPVLKY